MAESSISYNEMLIKQKASPFPSVNGVLALLVLICCGGYAIGAFSWMKPWYSVTLLVGQCVWICYIIYSWIKEGPEGETDGFTVAIAIAIMALVIVVTIVLLICHFWWPQVSAGILAAFNLVGFGIAGYDVLKPDHVYLP